MDPAGRKIKNKKSISNIISLERVFHLKQHHTDIQTEITAGITSFMAMSYILAVNPSILADAGMDKGAVFTATALSACIASCLMAFLAGYPFVLAPGLGLSVYFFYTVDQSMGFTCQMDFSRFFSVDFVTIMMAFLYVDMFDTLGTLIGIASKAKLLDSDGKLPIFATTSALVISGFSMFTSVVKIDFCDYSEAIPCFITILSMPFFYSISEGISLGIISYVVLNLVAGKTKEKNISPLMYVLAGLFTLKYFVL